MKTHARTRDQGGFALAMVVFLLFAIAVAGATGFQVVSNEFTLATQNRDSQEALVIARAGLQRFLGESLGVVGDSVSYGIGNGVATVTTRKVYQRDSSTYLYYIRSEGSVADARTPLSPAERAVAAYAWHHVAPVPQKGAYWVSGSSTSPTTTLSINGYTRILGWDYSSGSCEGAGTKAGLIRTGLVSPSWPTSYVAGSPVTTAYASASAMLDTAGIRWDVLTNANFPVDYEGSSPGDLGAESYPIVRKLGDLDATYDWSGRGVLIVTGTLRLSWYFRWEGIILAGAMAGIFGDPYYLYYYPPVVNGMVIAGLNGANPSYTLSYGYYRYDSCDAYKASKALSYLELLDNTIVEVNG